MNSVLDRGLITQAIVALGMCIGAWMLLVRPQLTALRSAEAEVVTAQQDVQSVSEQIFNKTVDRIKTVKTRLAEIERRNNIMHDSSRLYGQMMDLAATHSVTIQNLQPGVEKLSTDAKYSVCRIDITAEGSFAHVTSFLGALDGLQGFFRPISLSMTPARDSAGTDVIAQYSCEAVNFKVPEALAMWGGDHGKP